MLEAAVASSVTVEAAVASMVAVVAAVTSLVVVALWQGSEMLQVVI